VERFSEVEESMMQLVQLYDELMVVRCKFFKRVENIQRVEDM
jgi:hypothetical protein